MPTGDELVTQAQQEMPSVPVQEVYEVLQAGEDVVVIDVREKDEWNQGHIPQAIRLTRGRIEQHIEEVVPDRDTPVVVH